MGHKVGWIADKLGFPLMPWQQLVADVGRELIPADEQTIEMYAARGVDAAGMMVPAYREVIVTVMRQSGKTTLVMPVQCECMWKPMSTVAYTAQTGLDGRQKFNEDQVPIIENSAINTKVRRFYKAADNTGMWWHNGSRLKVLNTGESAGHGKTLDLAVLDETWHDKDDSREQALSPAMVTKPQAQFWNLSTAGTQESTFLKRKVELGRAAANSGSREGIAYFEWAIPEDEDVFDPKVWARYMPAFGITQSERILRLEAKRMKEGEFRRAYGNQWTETDERLIPGEWWQAVQDHSARAKAGVVYAADANPDRSQAAVVKADRDGNVEVVAVRAGTSWVADELNSKLDGSTRVVFDRNGPLASLNDDLTTQKEPLDSLGVRKSCARFYDAVADQKSLKKDDPQKIRVRSDERLDDAVRNAARKSTADAWGWNRDALGGEILMAASLAYSTAVSDGEWEPVSGWA